MRLLIFFVISSIFYTSISFGQTTNHHVFQTNDQIAEIRLDLDGPTIMKKTEGSRILVETSIQANLPYDHMLDVLIKAGRYDIQVEEAFNSEVLTLKSNHRKNVLVVKGEECEEIISHVIYVPDNIQVIKGLSTFHD